MIFKKLGIYFKIIFDFFETVNRKSLLFTLNKNKVNNTNFLKYHTQ